MQITIYGYDMDSLTMSSQQIDGLGLMEVILTFSNSRGGVNYIDDHTIKEHCIKIVNLDTRKEIFNACDRHYEEHYHHGSEYGGEETHFRCDWSYNLAINMRGWIYVTDVHVANNCTFADKKAGIYVFADGEYRWRDP